MRRLPFLAALLATLVVAGCARAPHRSMLTLPASFAPTVSAPGGFYLTLERGQTLYRIAKTYRVDLAELMRVNQIQDPSHLEIGQRIFVPQPFQPTLRAYPTVEPVTLEDARRIVGPRRFEYFWKTITVHHSGTLQGGARSFDRDHQRRHMGGLFYHFVIGNGSYSGDGQIEVGWRWQRQVRANRPFDVQICLVGDFNRQQVSEAQFRTLVNLVTALQETYGIPVDKVRKHGGLPGKHTDCPGKNFPFDRLLSELETRRTV